MGMFDFKPSDSTAYVGPGFDTYASDLAFSGYGGMMSSLGKLAGFQDEEDMLKQIYSSADFETDSGRRAAVDAVMAINPEKGAELQKMLTEQAIGDAQLATAELATESAELQNVMIKHGSKLNREFVMSPADGGQSATIQQWFATNNIPTGEVPPTTFTGALKYIYSYFTASDGTIDRTMAGNYRDDLKNNIDAAKDNWIQSGAMAIMEEGSAENVPTYSAEEAFNANLLEDEEWEKFIKEKVEAAQKSKLLNLRDSSGLKLGGDSSPLLSINR